MDSRLSAPRDSENGEEVTPVDDCQSSDAPASFRTALEVVDYLTSLGFKVSKSAIYNHVKDKKLVKDADGCFSLANVSTYAQKHLPKVDGSAQTRAANTLQTKKAQEELELLKARRQKVELQNAIEAGRYIPREQHDQALASRARLLRSDMLRFGRLHMDDLIALVGGDASKAPEALELYEKNVEDWLDHYARGEQPGAGD